MNGVILQYYLKALGLSFLPVFLAFWYASGFSNKEAQIGIFITVVYGLLSAILYSPIFLININVIQQNAIGRNICVFFHFILTALGILTWSFKNGFDKGILIIGSIYFFLDLLITLYLFYGLSYYLKNLDGKIE